MKASAQRADALKIKKFNSYDKIGLKFPTHFNTKSNASENFWVKPKKNAIQERKKKILGR